MAGPGQQAEGPGWGAGLARLVTGLCLAAVLGGAVYGLERLKDHVCGLPEYNPPIRLELADPPEWVVREGWGPRILSSVKLPLDQSAAGKTSVQQIYEQLFSSGWVSRIRCVNRRIDGTIRIICDESDYRRPIAMVLIGGVYIPVDKEGVRLPEEYQRVEINSGWMRIFGVESVLPDRGKPFEGDDARAAIRIASLIWDQEFAPRITGIDVRNYQGRRDRREPHVFLLAWVHNRLKRLQWGSAVNEEYEENTAAEKIRNLAVFFRTGAGSPQAASYDFSVYPTGWIERFEPDMSIADGSEARDP